MTLLQLHFRERLLGLPQQMKSLHNEIKKVEWYYDIMYRLS